MTLLLAIAAGALIGLSLGALGGGGSVLAVPVLAYLLGQSPSQATTGSLVVVGATSVVGALAARRRGQVLLARGVGFGLVSLGGAVAGAKASAHVPGEVLMAAFSAVLLIVAASMLHRRLRRTSRDPSTPGPGFDDPIITFSPTFACQCPRAVKVLVTATVVGLLTGFLGVGGGFLVVPALVLALGLPMSMAAGTSLVVISITSASALAVRAGVGAAPDWTLVAVLTLAAAIGGLLGARLATRVSTARLSDAFTLLVLVVAVATAVTAWPALL